MTNLAVEAKLIGDNTIQIDVDASYVNAKNRKFALVLNGKTIENLKCISKSDSNRKIIYTVHNQTKIIVGYDYQIKDDSNEFYPLDVSYLATKQSFIDKYKTDLELGAIYSKESTTFRVFSPLASDIAVVIETRDGKDSQLHNMTKDFETGLFEITVKGDFDGFRYRYLVKIMGEIHLVVDPYAFSLSTNSRFGYIVDMNKVLAIPNYDDKLPKVDNYNDHVIYELDVRDMTSLTDVEHKGTFDALTREGLKNENELPIGMDYIKNLHVNTVQILPFYDFQTIDESNPSSQYNWGYDPKFYFAPEGSYAKDPEDPYSRIIELKKMISTFHKNGIRVNMDVVFNHVYSRNTNSLEILCPNYYFRLNPDGTNSNGSFCGNDIESTHYMCQKLIIDALIHFVKYYGVDGYRFDLMAIIDKATLLKAFDKLKAIKPDIMIYGEGWDMPTNLPSNMKSSSLNSFSMENIGFFNDRFRDIVKGKTSESELAVKGYLSGDTNYIDGFKHVYLGSSVAMIYPPMFKSCQQSINYCECHDNSTLFDKLSVCNKEDSLDDKLKRIKLINSAIMFSAGVPFFHMGQEVGLSKQGEANSYNSSDQINGMQYDVAYKRKEMISYFKDLIRLRNDLPCFKIHDNQELINTISFTNLDKGALLITYSLEKEDIYVIFNPSKESFTYNFDKYVKVIFSNTGYVSHFYDFYSYNYLVNGLTFSVLRGDKRK